MSYNIGQVIKFDRHHLNDTVGIIVKKWYSGDRWNYLVSLVQFKGDYCCLAEDHIKGIQDLSLEYKLALLSSFGGWWYTRHKSIYQNILVCAIK